MNTFAALAYLTLSAPIVMCILVKLTGLFGYLHYKRKGDFEMALRFKSVLHQSSIRFMWNAFMEEQNSKKVRG